MQENLGWKFECFENNDIYFFNEKTQSMWEINLKYNLLVSWNFVIYDIYSNMFLGFFSN